MKVWRQLGGCAGTDEQAGRAARCSSAWWERRSCSRINERESVARGEGRTEGGVCGNI